MPNTQDPNVVVPASYSDPALSDHSRVQIAQPQLPIQQQVFDQTQQLNNDRPLAAMNAMMTQVAQPDPLNPAYPTPSAKEQPPMTVEFSGELPAGVQSVETLRSPEISPEVEKYIEEVRENPDQFPHEVVLADQKMVMPANGFVAQPVIVLPMTQQEFEEGKKAPVTTSKRWLSEWTEKIKKMFSGSVIFRTEN